MIHLKKRILLVSAFVPFFLSACLSENDFSDTLLSSEANLVSAAKAPIQKEPLLAISSFDNYSGNKNAAVLNQTQTLSFVDLLYPTVAFDSRPYTQTSAKTSGVLSGLLKHQKAILNTALAQKNSNPESRKDSGIYDFKHCLYEGSAQHQTETLYKFTNCQQFQNLSINGEVTLTDQEVRFTDLVINDNGKMYHYSGNISAYHSNDKQVIKINTQGIDVANNKQQYFKDFVWANGKIDQLKGRVYNGESGFIELSSSEDLKLDDNGIPTRGTLHLHGKDYGKVFLGKPKNKYFGSIRIEIDEEGDGFNEFRIGKNVIYQTTSKVYAAR